MQEFSELGFVSLTISLFLVFNAVGQIPVFLALLAKYKAAHQRKIIFRELIIALIIILLFTFFGAQILHLVGISQAIIGITGGLVLVLIALNLIFPKDVTTKGYPSHEPLVVPLAMPGLAGPGTITAVMLFSAQKGVVLTAVAFVIAWVPSLVILLLASYIKNYLGEKGVQAVERLGGMLICLIGVQMMVKGIVGIVKEHFLL